MTLTACGAKPDAGSPDTGSGTSVDAGDTVQDADKDESDTSYDDIDSASGDESVNAAEDSDTTAPVRDIASEIEALTANKGTADDTLLQCAPHCRSDGMEWPIGDGWARNQYTGRWGVPDMTLGYDCLARVTGMPDDVRQQVTDTAG